MLGILAHTFRWLFSKAAQLILLWGVVLVAVAVFLWSERFLERLPQELAQQESIVFRIRGELGQLDARLDEVRLALQAQIAALEAKRQEIQADLKQREAQLRQWQERMARLRGAGARARTFWDKLRGVDADTNQVEVEILEEKIKASLHLQNGLREQIVSANREQASLEEASNEKVEEIEALREAKAAELEGAEDERSQVQAQTDRWESRFNRVKDLLKAAYEKMGKPLVWISLSILFLPIIAKLTLFFAWAPLLALGRPVVIRPETQPPPLAVSGSAVAQEVVLGPGEVATIQHRFYQASDEDLRKRTKFVFSWRYPFSSMACGLFLLTRVTNENAEARRRLTLSSQSEAEIEMAVVEIPEGGSLICRPSFVAALVQHEGQEPKIRSHWRWFSLHAWITLQFRYFEFQGPVKLVLWAYRGIRAEDLSLDADFKGRERRTNQLATIGFTPGLQYRSRRSETFVSYLRNQNPLFDDLFSGKGVFLCQQISRSEQQGKAGRFWANLWNGFTKIFGI